jgi:FAD/FMN-containing dehydrogenase
MSDALRALRAELAEIVFGPGDDEYAAATSPDNSSFSQRPFAVVRPRSAEQVAQTVQGASRLGVSVVVQATGHGTGRQVRDGQLLLDTSALTGVTVDVTSGTARIEAGSMWPAVQGAAFGHGLLGLSGTSPTVGVLGYTFGGGVGWFVRKYGLASAALLSVDYVDGAGRLRHASADATDPLDREAFWAFRGGAPVGLATAIEIALFDVPDLWTGYLLWPADDLPAVAAAWTSAVREVTTSVTSSFSLLKLPAEGPFPDQLLGRAVVHLSYASPDGGTPLEVMHDAVRGAATPVLDTTGPGDVQSLSAIHLDPPAAVPARGMGRWLGSGAAELVTEMFDVGRVGQPGGLNMIELRHTESAASAPDGALTAVPSPFLLHAVGGGVDDDARRRTDEALEAVEAAGRAVDVGRAATSFREGQPDVADAWSSSDQKRIHTIRAALDPDRVLSFQRHPAP